MAVFGRTFGHLVGTSHAAFASFPGEALQQEKSDVFQYPLVYCGRYDYIYRKELSSLSSDGACDYRTWNLWNLWYYIRNAAGCD